MADEQLMFDYIDLNEIDPSFTLLPPDMYTVRILKMEKKDFTYKNGVKAGQQGQMITTDLAVVNHPNYSGRRIFPTLFPSNYTFRVLRRIADNTGLPQEPGTMIDAWLQTITEAQPLLKVPVDYAKDRDGNVVLNAFGNPESNAVNWAGMQPAE